MEGEVSAELQPPRSSYLHRKLLFSIRSLSHLWVCRATVGFTTMHCTWVAIEAYGTGSGTRSTKIPKPMVCLAISPFPSKIYRRYPVSPHFPPTFCPQFSAMTQPAMASRPRGAGAWNPRRCWRFPKMGVPPTHPYLMGVPIRKPSVWGPKLWKTSILGWDLLFLGMMIIDFLASTNL